MTRKRSFVAALVTVASISVGGPRVARADTYAWTDESGAKHLTDRLSAVPEQYRSKAIRIGGASSAPAQPAAPSAAPGAGTGSTSGPGGDEIFRMGEEPVARTPTAPAAPEPSTEAQTPDNPTDKEGHDKHWWQQQMAGALNRQSRAADAVRTLEGNKIVLAYGQPADKTKYRDDLAKARAELEASEKALAELRKHAKVAGADAAWLVLPGMETTTNTKGGVEKKQP